MAKFTLSSLDVCGGVSVSVGPQILSPEISCRLTIAFASLVPQAPQSRVSRVIFGGWRELMLGILGYRVFVLLIWSKFAYDKVSLADGIAFDISVRWHQRVNTMIRRTVDGSPTGAAAPSRTVPLDPLTLDALAI